MRRKPQQFIRHPAATFISLLYLLHKRSYVLRACTYTRAHGGNADAAALRAFIPYGEALAVRDGNRYGFVISVTYAARGVGLCFIPRKLYVINFLESIPNG